MKRILFILILMAYGIAFAANKALDKTVGYDYDLTLSYSTPTFAAEKQEDPANRLAWDLINGRLLKLEKKKHVALTVPIAKFLGYTPIVITARQEVNGGEFRDHVRLVYGIKPEDVYMTRDKAAILAERKTVLFFGDSDGDITEARDAGVRVIRVKRSGDDRQKKNYNPGQYGEFVLPFSEGYF